MIMGKILAKIDPKTCFMPFMPKYGNLDQTPQKLKILKNSFMTIISLVIRFQRALNYAQGIILTQDIDLFPIFDPLSPLCPLWGIQ